MNEKNKNKDVDPMLALGAVVMVLGAAFYSNANEIEFWIYQHLMKVVGAVFALVAVLAGLSLYRLKTKEAEAFLRLRAVKRLRPKQGFSQYFGKGL